MEQLSLRADTTEAQALEPVLWNKRSHCSEKPMLRKAHKQQRQSIDKIYTQECGSLLPRGTGPFGYAFHSPHATDIRSEIQKATASPQTPMSDLLQVAYSVFDNRDMVKMAEHSREIHKGLK